MEFRINAVMTRNHLDREEVMRYIRKMDEERVAWTRFLYHVDWRDSGLYDIVVNLDRMGLDNACRLLCDAVSFDQFRTPSNWEEIRANLIQGSQVRAADSEERANR